MQVINHASEWIHPSFETQGRHHCLQVQVSGPTKKTDVLQIFFLKKVPNFFRKLWTGVLLLTHIADVQIYIHAHWSKHIDKFKSLVEP